MTNTHIFPRFTKRIYNHQPLLTVSNAKVIKIGENYIELDQTIAYPEGGGQEITIEIDIERRAKLSISHTAPHILYMVVQYHRAEALSHIFGCHIKPEGARFDFYGSGIKYAAGGRQKVFNQPCPQQQILFYNSYNYQSV